MARKTKPIAVIDCCPSVLGPSLDEAEAAALARGFSALADPARLRLLNMLASAATGEVCACDFVEPLGKSQPTVSHHLKVLSEAGLITGDKRGRWVWYSIVPERLDALRTASGCAAMASRFPDGFRWGTATAAHQVEGNNVNNDWWEWEHRPDTRVRRAQRRRVRPVPPLPRRHRACSPRSASTTTASRSSGVASNPRRAAFSTAALDHYRRVCATCLGHGVDPVVTFHHFTTPRWATADGGWADPTDRRPVHPLLRARGRPPRRPDRACACTINEPNVVSLRRLPWSVRSRPGILDARPAGAQAYEQHDRRAPQEPTTRSRPVRATSPSASRCR